MNTIDVKKAIEESGADIKEIAAQLFPGNKYPKLALNRVLSGEAYLDSVQVSKLSMLLGIKISDLYESNWKMESKKDMIIFESGSYRAELSTKTWVTKLFDKGSLFHETIIHGKYAQLSEYLKKLNSIIIKHKQNVKTNGN